MLPDKGPVVAEHLNQGRSERNALRKAEFLVRSILLEQWQCGLVPLCGVQYSAFTLCRW